MTLNYTKVMRPYRLQSRVYDVIVIGGGITGAGVALDAASRGLSVLVLEKGDFASGTSSKSTKLIHGGLRYLQNLQVRVTLESVRERQMLMQLAPHMVWSVPFLIPLYRHEVLHNAKLRVGLSVYDAMAKSRGGVKHKRISPAQVMHLCPGVDSAGLIGGLQFYDCRTDDARHTLEVLKLACENGAHVANYARVEGFTKTGDGYVSGVVVRDELDNDEPAVEVKASTIINATGVWTEQTAALTGTPSTTSVAPAKGVHIVLSNERLPIQTAMLLPSPHDKRFFFAVPWYGSVVVGTTDTQYEGDLDKVPVEEDEVQYILDSVNAMFPQAHVSKTDVRGSFAGSRPLIRRNAEGASTADLSREHHLERAADGLITIAGGKFTTYRTMAKETVDLAVSFMGRSDIPPSRTDEMLLGGWRNAAEVPERIEGYRRLLSDLKLGSDTIDYLPTVYGRETSTLAIMMDIRPRYRELVAEGHPYVMGQVDYAVNEEAARTIDDVLSRRIRLSIIDRDAAIQAAPKVAKLMAQTLGWSAAEQEEQVRRFVQALKQ